MMMMHNCICMCLCLLTLIAALFLLAKVQKEALGMFLKVMSYATVTLSALCLICCLWCMCCMHGEGMGGHCGRGDEGCGQKKECCKGDKEHCAKDGMSMEHHEMMSADTAAEAK